MFILEKVKKEEGSYWTEGTYSGDYYEVYGVLKRSDVYSSGHYYGSSMGHASSSRTLKINTRVYTKFYGPEDDIINYDTTGKGSVSSNGNTRWPASYANYKYYINNANIKDIKELIHNNFKERDVYSLSFNKYHS